MAEDIFMKKFAVCCLVIAMVLLTVAFPTGALAAAYSKNVTVFGVNVNTGGTTYWKVYQESRWHTYTLTSSGTSAADYNGKYDRSSQTLTLKNVYAPNAYPSNNDFISFQYTQYYNDKYTVNVVLEGTNTIARPGYSMNSGFGAQDGVSLVFSSTCTLNLSDVERGISASGNKGGGITINSVNYNINCKGDCALNSQDGNIFINGGDLNLRIDSSDSHVSAISAGGANPAEGGVVSGGGTYAKNANVTVSAVANENYSFQLDRRRRRCQHRCQLQLYCDPQLRSCCEF